MKEPRSNMSHERDERLDTKCPACGCDTELAVSHCPSCGKNLIEQEIPDPKPKIKRKMKKPKPSTKPPVEEKEPEVNAPPEEEYL